MCKRKLIYDIPTKEKTIEDGNYNYRGETESDEVEADSDEAKINESGSSHCDIEFNELDNDIEREDEAINAKVKAPEGWNKWAQLTLSMGRRKWQKAHLEKKMPGGTMSRVIGVLFNNPESEHEESDREFRSFHSNSSEKEDMTLLFDAASNMARPKFKLIQRFSTMYVLRQVVRVYFVHNRVKL